MDERLYRLNTTYAVVDTLMCLAAILCFGFAAWYFGKWWINLFNLLPLALFNRHTIVLETANDGEEGQNDD